jgi:hypothetical protein
MVRHSELCRNDNIAHGLTEIIVLQNVVYFWLNKYNPTIHSAYIFRQAV